MPTLGGAPVTLKIPAGTPNGRTFRVRGKGAPKSDGTKGDLLVTVEVQVPAVARRGRPRGRRGLPRRDRRQAAARRSSSRRRERDGPRQPFEPPGPDAAVYVISVAAELTGLHPQTLRTYDRMGLVTPGPHRWRRSALLPARHRAAARDRRAHLVRHRHRGRTPDPRPRAPGRRPGPAQRRAVAELEPPQRCRPGDGAAPQCRLAADPAVVGCVGADPNRRDVAASSRDRLSSDYHTWRSIAASGRSTRRLKRSRGCGARWRWPTRPLRRS